MQVGEISSGVVGARAVIGGSGLYEMEGFAGIESIETPYGVVDGITAKTISGCRVYFLPRHGQGHSIPPHKINYRANIWALHSLGVTEVLAVNAVGGITSLMSPGCICVPDQVIDYSYGREHTFFDGSLGQVKHVDFAEPFCPSLRGRLIEQCRLSMPADSFVEGGVYACTQGPRLESAAEIRRLKSDGCDIVGMTLMPEAALVRELGMGYGSLCAVANWGAGLDSEPLTMDLILEVLSGAIGSIKMLISGAIMSTTPQS